MHESVWLAKQVAGDEAAAELVERHGQRLLALARKKLPARLSARVEPEDVVQSVYRSFFRRLEDGEFSFEDSHDIWRLLAVMTCHRVVSKVKLNQQARRDVRREAGSPIQSIADEIACCDLEPEDLAIFHDSLDQLVDELPERYREILRLRMECRSVEEFPDADGTSRRTTLRVLSNMRAAALRHLEKS